MEQAVVCQYKLTVNGLVQGVGFRPFIWHLAKQHQLVGDVSNNGHGVSITIQGPMSACEAFTQAIVDEPPPLARIDKVTTDVLDVSDNISDFTIIESEHSDVEIAIVADAATCEQCIADINDPNNARYQYAFTNCTHCGPRYSIVRALPYDRAQTSMSEFVMCPTCQEEYDNPADRRFHAQPNACPVCGPEVWLEINGERIQGEYDAIVATATLIKQGKVVAIKGIGGYQLLCDATNEEAINTLRARKNRPAKPFALMARSVAQIKSYCHVSDLEAKTLKSSAAPIILLHKKPHLLPEIIAPGHHRLGFVLPYSPLHHLLMANIDTPVIFTSGNKSSLPQCTSVEEAQQDLVNYADAFLHHNRPIVNRVDDSVISIYDQEMYFYRRSRGYSPTSMTLDEHIDTQHSETEIPAILACGSQMKNTFSLLRQNHLICSQYIGDLDNSKVIDEYNQQVNRQCELFQIEPEAIAVDCHPEYHSRHFGLNLAEQKSLPVIEVQHHHAHLASCLLDNQHKSGRVVGCVMDGLGFGTDGTIWGGEILVGDYKSYQRLGRISPVAMPGGTQAILQPWRMLLAHLYEADKQQATLAYEALPQLANKPIDVISRMIDNNVNSPLTSSCGRLFDAVAAALDICFEEISYEGQAAIELQQLAMSKNHHQSTNGYHFSIIETDDLIELNPGPMWRELLNDLVDGESRSLISFRFHKGLAQSLITVAAKVCEMQNIGTIALCGGVYQNELLLQLCQEEITNKGLKSYIHKNLPSNDACISVGQAIVAAHQLRRD